MRNFFAKKRRSPLSTVKLAYRNLRYKKTPVIRKVNLLPIPTSYLSLNIYNKWIYRISVLITKMYL